jgi:hypothetical protein
MKLLHLALLATIVTGTLSSAYAQETVVPGKSLWGVDLGSSRQASITSFGKRFVKAKNHRSKTYGGGLTWDGWEISKGDQFTLFEMLSKRGKVIQLRTFTSAGGASRHNFAKLAKVQPLRKRHYLFLEEGGGGYNAYYYDNLKKGICYTAGTQDDFKLTYLPDGLIVHRPGFPAVAIEGEIRGKRVTGS